MWVALRHVIDIGGHILLVMHNVSNLKKIQF